MPGAAQASPGNLLVHLHSADVNNMGFEYDSDSSTERWLILSDMQQDFPTESFAIEEAKNTTTSAGKPMPVLVLKGVESGDVVRICAWKRDVLPCIKEYGSKPEQWGHVGFQKKNNRYELVPRATQAVEQTVG